MRRCVRNIADGLDCSEVLSIGNRLLPQCNQSVVRRETAPRKLRDAIPALVFSLLLVLAACRFTIMGREVSASPIVVILSVLGTAAISPCHG